MSVLQSETLIFLSNRASHQHKSLVTGYLLRNPDNSNFFSISLKGLSYRESTVHPQPSYTLPEGHLLFHSVLHLCNISWNLLFITSHQSAIVFRLLLWIVRNFCTRLEQSRNFPQVHETLVTWFSLSLCFGKSAAFTGGSLLFWVLIKEKELKQKQKRKTLAS